MNIMKYAFTRNEAAEILGVTRQTITNWVNNGILESKSITDHNMISKASVDKLIEYCNDIGEVEKNISEYKKHIHSIKDDLKDKLNELKCKYGMLCDTPTALELFLNAFSVLSKDYEQERTIDIISSYIRGEEIANISMRYNISYMRIGQIIGKGIRRLLSKADKYKLLTADNERLALENNELKLRISFLENNTDKQTGNVELTKILCQKLVGQNLNYRVLNCLHCANIYTIGDLVKLNKNDLLKFRNFGRKSLRELDELLNDKGLRWNMTITDLNK